FYYFFFQAEDGIRDDLVTGVQTCALPISRAGKNHLLAGRFLRQDHYVELSVRELINRTHIRASWNNPMLMKTYYRVLIGRRVGAPVDQPRISGFDTVSGEVHRLALVRHDHPARL